MWKPISAGLLSTAILAGCGDTQGLKPETAPSAALKSGIDQSLMDTSVNPADDFYLYAVGTWDKNTEIPADKVIFSSASDIDDRISRAVQDIVKDVAAKTSLPTGSPEKQVADFYRAYMDEAAIEAQGLQPLQADWAAIAAVQNKSELAAVMGELYKKGIKTPLDFGVWGDRKNPTINILYMVQNGLGLPDKENYLEDNERNQKLHKAYLSYLEKMLTYAGHAAPADTAKAIYALEKEMAIHSWTQVDSRNTDKNYNKMTPQELATLAPGFDWSTFFAAVDYDKAKEIVVYQPSFMTGFAKLVEDTDLQVWKDYFSARLIISSASFMHAEVYDTHFDFYSRTLYGAEQPRPRWKRAIRDLNRRIGESVGKVFLKEYFPPQAKSKMDELVANLLIAMDHRINNLAWMSDETKVQAHDKLSKISPQIGYPSKWRDYSSISISKDALLQNIWSTNAYVHYDSVNEIGKAVDKEIWSFAPQTVNAFYSPTENKIMFPAGYLQAPNFQLDADDAANYGAIGVTIGHEIGHGFDDQGSKNDGDGVLRNWWTEKDREQFKARSGKLIEQFNKFCPFDDACLNGELSLGENIGDLAGLLVAYDAYQLSLNGKQAPVIDGLTGDERFMLSFAQAGKGKWRDDFVRTLIVTDPHVPDMYRVLGPLQNFDLFYKTYNVKEGDGMYLPPEERVRIW